MSVSLKCSKCGKDSTVGCHGSKDGKVVSTYYCDDCFNALKKGKKK